MKKIFFIITLAVVALTVFIPKYYFARSETSCDTLYRLNPLDMRTQKQINTVDNNIKCKQLVRDGKTLFTLFKKDTALKNADCEKEPYKTRVVCYFKLAVDQREPRYCNNLVSKDFCLLDLAIQLGDKKTCDTINPLYSKRCAELATTCKDVGSEKNPGCKMLVDFRCPAYDTRDYESTQKEALACVQKYGKEYAGTPYDFSTSTLQR